MTVTLPRGAAARLAAVPMPSRIAALQRDGRGYPIPRFVDRKADRDGQPDFRVMDGAFMVRAVRHRLCWICGDRMGRFMCFAVGPMCIINRTSAEPPSHLECCRYSAQVCPFLAVPAMRRIEANMPEHTKVAGTMLARNPGVVCLWTVEQYRPFRVDNGALFEIGSPTAVEWWAEGRAATRAEVDASIAGGMPTLEAVARTEAGGMEALAEHVQAAQQFLPSVAT